MRVFIHVTMIFNKVTWDLHISLSMNDGGHITLGDFQFPFKFVAAGCLAFIVNSVVPRLRADVRFSSHLTQKKMEICRI